MAFRPFRHRGADRADGSRGAGNAIRNVDPQAGRSREIDVHGRRAAARRVAPFGGGIRRRDLSGDLGSDPLDEWEGVEEERAQERNNSEQRGSLARVYVHDVAVAVRRRSTRTFITVRAKY